MAQVIADKKDVEFVIHEQLKLEELSKEKKFRDFNKKTINMVINEARNLAIKEILPTFKDGDLNGCKFDDGVVTVPDSFKRAYKLFNKGEWLAMTEDPKYGGQGMPRSLAIAASDYFNGANFSFMMYAGLTHGAALLIDNFGSERQKNIYLNKMFSGKWTGTMLLTEPDAGSDVGNLSTRAVKNIDGTYSITGTKIFISSGEHDMTENIVHPVLARIEGAPKGTKGISLFLVSKYRVNNDGNLGEFNDVICTGIEEKMGIHGNSTCSLTLGSKDRCIGELLGEENKGMKMMFLMMNEARLLVGMQGFCCASASYLNAVNYAKERVQGVDITNVMNRDGDPVPIIKHPDIRRMLVFMKSHVEGMRSLLYYTAYLSDKILVSKNTENINKYQGIIDFLIPICKGYVTDKSFEICNLGLQIYGGYGYTKEYPQEQYLRDCRITMIYEGTNGIQGMDLLGRKLGLNKGKAVLDVMNEIMITINHAKKIEKLSKFASEIEVVLNHLGKVAIDLGTKAMSEKVSDAFAFASPFMEVVGDLLISWMLLWRAFIASEKLEKSNIDKNVAFYNGQINSLKYFVEAILPLTIGKMNSISNSTTSIMEMSEDSFGGK